jgi:hypothetical protein
MGVLARADKDTDLDMIAPDPLGKVGVGGDAHKHIYLFVGPYSRMDRWDASNERYNHQ